MSEEGIKLVAACHCGRHRFSATIPSSELPFKTPLCSCDQCRYVTGNLCVSDINLPPRPEPYFDLSSLSVYDHSPRMQLFWCADCGAHMFFDLHTGGRKPAVFVGVIESAHDIISFDRHLWLSDAEDGGVGNWVSEVSGQTLAHYSGNVVEGAIQESQPVARLNTADSGDQGDDVLEASCLCGGVQFDITRPHRVSSDRSFEHDFWQETGDRFYSGVCVCHDCRATTGSPFLAMAFVPTSCIKQKNGEQYQPTFGSLKAYETSSNAKRYFCSGCGALAFFAHKGMANDEHAGLLGVGAGLLRSKTGALANDWLLWDVTNVHSEESTNHAELLKGLKDGLISWGRAAYDENSIALSQPRMYEILQKSIKAARASG